MRIQEPTTTQVSEGCSPNGYNFLHHVHSGETLTRILNAYYGSPSRQWLAQMIDQVMWDNPQIVHPDRIEVGSAILLRRPFRFSTPQFAERQDLNQANAILKAMPPNQRRWVREAPDLLDSLGPLLGGTADLANNTNRVLERAQVPIQQIAKKYLAYKEGKLSRHAYYQLRSELLAKYRTGMGQWMHESFFHTKAPTKAFRISPALGRRANQILAVSPRGALGLKPLANQIGVLEKVSRNFKYAGTTLGVIGLGVSGYQLYSHWDEPDFWEVVGKEVGGLVTGSLAGWAVGALLVSLGAGGLAVVVFATLAAVVGGFLGGKRMEQFAKELVPQVKAGKLLWLSSASP